MVTASRILGDQVGSTAPVFLAFLTIHVIAGLTAVSTGAIAALTRKGSPRHIRAGRWFYRAIAVVFATAIALAIMRWRQDYYLVIIGDVAFTAATIGYQHRRRHRPGDTGHILGMGIGYTAMLTAFYVDNGPHLPLWDRLPTLAFWLLPSAVAAPLITRAVIHARRGQPTPGGSSDTWGEQRGHAFQGGGNEPVACGGDCTSVSSRLEQGQLAKPRSRAMTSCAAARLTAPCSAEESCGRTVPRPTDHRAGLRRTDPWRSRRQPALNVRHCCASRPLPCRGDAAHHEMPGKRLTHPSRVTLKVSLAAGVVLGSKFEKSP